MMVPSNRALSPNADAAVAEVIDGEAILINLATSVYYSMDGVGGMIWSLIEAERSIDDIVESVVARYEVSPEQAESDVGRVVAELVREELLVVSEREPSRGPDGQAPSERRQPYAPPELKAYRDMGDLLALDPHLPGVRSLEEAG
jgi:coenzyme PQQ synthesis protein D (PqqD)